MCACEPHFTCARCAGTPSDPRYPELPDDGEDDARRAYEALTSPDETGDRRV